MTHFNINRNNSLMVLEELVNQNITTQLKYMPDSFNEQQDQALQFFKQRIFLEKTIDESISFNKNIVFPNKNKNLHLATTAEDLVDVFKLRSDIYTNINYQNEFPDMIEGLNFDKYDSNSAILFYKKDNTITGTTRLIFDSDNLLPSESNYSFNDVRKIYTSISEVSRLAVKHENKRLNFEFKYLFGAIHDISQYNNMQITLFGIKKEHYKLYSKFGGITILKELETYGSFSMPCLIISWDPSKVSPFFKKAFLK